MSGKPSLDAMPAGTTSGTLVLLINSHSAGRRRAATSTNAAEQNQTIAETDNQIYAPAVDAGIV